MARWILLALAFAILAGAVGYFTKSGTKLTLPTLYQAMAGIIILLAVVWVILLVFYAD